MRWPGGHCPFARPRRASREVKSTQFATISGEIRAARFCPVYCNPPKPGELCIVPGRSTLTLSELAEFVDGIGDQLQNKSAA